MIKTASIAFAAAAALLAAPSAYAGPKLTGEAKLAKLLEGREAGKPVDCINIRTTRSSRIIDKTAIVYDAGSVIYVNRPANPEHLDDNDVLVTTLHSSNLCSVDIVRTRESSMLFPTGFVSLEKFVPYRKVARAD